MVRKYFNIYWLLGIWNFVNAAFVGLLYVQFYRQQVSLAEVLLAEAVASGVVALLVFARTRLRLRWDMVIGFLIIALALCLLLLPWSHAYFYLHVLLRGVGSVIFYIPLNILFFSKTADDRRARQMSQYWAVGIVTSIAGPLVGSYIFIHFGLTVFLVVAAGLMALGTLLMGYVPDALVTYTRRQLLHHMDRMRTISMVDGSLHRLPLIISIFAVLFVRGEQDYGLYLSLTALVAVGVGYAVAHASDKKGERMKYITPASLVGFVVVVLFAFAKTALVFFTLAVAIKIVSIVSDPLRSTIVLDQHAGTDPVTWLSREFYLNIGRAILQGTVALCLYLGSSHLVFVVLALPYLFFPILVHHKRIYRLSPDEVPVTVE